MKQAVFLDRDGTINRDVGYLSNPDQLELIPGSAEAIRILNSAEFSVVIISNQAGIAKGLIQEGQLPEIQKVLLAMLQNEDAKVDGFYYCPHHPEGSVKKFSCSCQCRKPAPGLLLKASEEMDIDLSRSYVVGDKMSDVQLAHNVGAVGIMVLTGHGRKEQRGYPPTIKPPDYTCNDLYDAVRCIIKKESGEWAKKGIKAQRSKGKTGSGQEG